MGGVASRFPEAIFLRRSDNTGFGFFFHDEEDFQRAAESFTRPILASFRGEPVPDQPDPQDHLATAINTFMGQAFDRTLAGEVGAEGVSRAAAACVRATFKPAVPRVVTIERRQGRILVRPGIEFMRHPGFPLAVVVDADIHGGDARFFLSPEEYRQVGESAPDARCWLPQIVFRLYERTPSVMLGRPLRDQGSGKTGVAFRGIDFGLPAPLAERQAAS